MSIGERSCQFGTNRGNARPGAELHRTAQENRGAIAPTPRVVRPCSVQQNGGSNRLTRRPTKDLAGLPTTRFGRERRNCAIDRSARASGWGRV
jgi:hypothetical protein